MFKNILYNLFVIIILFSSIVSLTLSTFENMNIYIRIMLVILPQLLLLLSIIFKWKKLKILSKLFISLFWIVSISLIIYTILDKLNILDNFSSVHALKEYILSTGSMGVITYILIQTLQVIFLPIPASIICIVGSLIYGPLLGGIYCSIGVLVGSTVSYG